MNVFGRLLTVSALLCGECLSTSAADDLAPKRLLVVSTSTRNRFQNSIDAAEKTLVRLAEQSHAFTLDFVHQPAALKLKKPAPPEALQSGANAEEQAVHHKATEDFTAAQAAYMEADKTFQDELKQALQKLSLESLKNYDAVVFCYTTGDLPLSDKDGFLSWIKDGRGFIALGSAIETMNSYPSYYDMLGGKWKHFTGPGAQQWAEVEIVAPHPEHPATGAIAARWTFEVSAYHLPSFTLSDPNHTRELLVIEKNPADQSPGHFPLAWAHDYGRGRVFCTTLGDDLWDPESKNRKNPPETARIFQAHLLGGIRWALGFGPVGNHENPPSSP